MINIDFYTVLVKIMLGLLLFDGAIHIDARYMKKQQASILVFSTAGVLISTFVVGGLVYLVCHLLDYPLTPLYCLLFGALISPTDPIAVLSIFKRQGFGIVSQVTGGILFNDSVAIIVFIGISSY
jgi:CPA1 family monovalent cation:H+ antiporter